MDKNIISSVPLFQSLPPEEIEQLARAMQEVELPAGTQLFKEGEHGSTFYIVLSGQVAIIQSQGTENERVLALRGSGEFIGEMSLLNRSGLRTAGARTASDARLLVLTRQDFDDLLFRSPTIAYEMLHVLSVRLTQAHSIAMLEMEEKNRQLARAYAELQAAQEQIIQKEIIEHELLQAREIQRSMLPTVMPKVKGFDVGACIQPARMVGGDLFDLIPLDADHLGVVICDVSGKGTPAALFMALTRSLLRAYACPEDSPEEVIYNVNRHLLGMNARGLFVTVIYGILERKTRTFRYVRAGHERPVLLDPDGGLTETPMGAGQVLGIFPRPTVETLTVTIPPGHTLLLYTDGVNEARSPDGSFFGLEGLAALAPSLSGLSAQESCEKLLKGLDRFRGTAPQADDITVIALQALP